MKTNKWVSSLCVRFALVIAILMAACATAVAAEIKPGERYDLRLRGLREGSGFTMMMISMGEATKRHYPKMTASCTPSSSGLENAVALQKGSADFAVTMDSLICRAGSYQIKEAGPLPNIRNVLAVDSAPFNIFVTKESGITSIEQLNDKNFAGNLPGTMVNMVLQFVLDEMGVKPVVKLMGTTACNDAIKDRKVVGTVKFGAPEPSVTELNATMGVRFLPIRKNMAVFWQKG
jgi:TRAP transporter TAXI family solute receptor